MDADARTQPADQPEFHDDEPHDVTGLAARLNWLRAGVLGANDGIVSVAALVVGVAGATSDFGTLLTAGLAAVIGGAISMALGEYVSVSSSSDSQKALIAKEQRELQEQPEEELAELAALYQDRGLTPGTAMQVAKELTAHDALAAHLHAELNMQDDDLVSPWHAAFASAIAFLLGAALPMLAMLLPPAELRIPVTFAAVLVALAATGATGAWLGGAKVFRAACRVVIGGALALVATLLIGTWLGGSGLV
ncbi:VIT family protein [Arthrobacter sp. CAU 1506]|uniref:VIT1/CCC1 transporter family protein n=1 Tax=Arthrobacter sp. CAU 1506 TaxID=2560052 RepID=UPI0010AD4FF2|nr:VIT family protein [Arthrobacter sp. CAU 1506]TJY69769.1 VIT family protein [Arthrobacter sp. CAU 1506]